MIRIQKLKEPKKTSGKKLDAGQAHVFHGIHLKNQNKYPVYVDYYQRKKQAPKAQKTSIR